MLSLSYWPGATDTADERGAKRCGYIPERWLCRPSRGISTSLSPRDPPPSLLEISPRALGYGIIQLYIGAFSYHAYFLRHHPEALEPDATSRAALRPTRRRRDLYSQWAPDTNRRSARRVHLQAQTLVAACFVNANSRLEPVAHFFHRQLRAEELGALGCQGCHTPIVEIL